VIHSVLAVVLAYLIGAVPCGYLIGKWFYGKDLRTFGSGNIGATNAYRAFGIKAGLAVFFCDFMKGFIAAHLGMPVPLVVLACAVASIVGNDWSIFLKFKSGKGVACGVGAFTYICWPAALAAFLVWLLLMKWKKIVSLASIVATPVVPIGIFIAGEPIEYFIFASLGAAMIIYKHKDNIGRLLRGEEKPVI